MLEDALPPGYIVRKEAPISGRDSEPEPDIALVRGALIDFLDIHPATAELVVKIALSSAEIDYRKRNIYSWADVEEYWIVFPELRQVNVYTEPIDGTYNKEKIYRDPLTIISEVLPAFQLDLATFFPR